MAIDLTRNLAERAPSAEEGAEAVVAGGALNAVLGTDKASLVHNKAAAEAVKEAENGTTECAAPALDLLGVHTVLDTGDPADKAARAAVAHAVADTRAPGGGHFFFVGVLVLTCLC